jgi:Glycosyl transferase family 2
VPVSSIRAFYRDGGRGVPARRTRVTGCRVACGRPRLRGEDRHEGGKGLAGLVTDETCDVTVVIPTRNRVRLLEDALRSALSQVDVSFEVRVVDDASTDGTSELLSGCLDMRVQHVRHESACGVAAARNRGVSEAKGEWLAFLDDDDLWAPTWLRTALEIGRTCQAGAVYGSRLVVDARRRVIAALPAAHASRVHGSLATANVLGGPSGVMVRADVMATAGGFDERLSALADWEAWLRVLDICHAAPVPDFLVAYTIYSDNMHARDPFGVLSEFEVFAGIVNSRGGTISNVDGAGLIRSLALDASRYGHRGTAARLWLQSARRARRTDDLLRAGLALLRGGTFDDVFAAPGWLSGPSDAAL